MNSSGLVGGIPLALLAIFFAGCGGRDHEGDAAIPPPVERSATANENEVGPIGLIRNDTKAYQGYTLLAPIRSRKTYLIDMQGKVVRMWQADAAPGLRACLLPTGELLRSSFTAERDQRVRIQKFSWDGELVWDFVPGSYFQPHHDFTAMPNGNVLIICSDQAKFPPDLAAVGSKASGQLLPDCLIEVRPTGPKSGEVVWEWHVWDHMIQDHDKTRLNYGVVGDHAGLIDTNYRKPFLPDPRTDPDEWARLRGMAYIGRMFQPDNDWTHANCVDYNADLDQIMLTVPTFGEIWIIDHATTTAEAAGHTGGRSGKGGDLLYRWGNPQAYRAGLPSDQQLFRQHHGHWIDKDLPHHGQVLIFNNGYNRVDGKNYSSVEEIILPVDSSGRYARGSGGAFGPDKPVWTYSAPNKRDFYAESLSSAQRLPNGNTLICSGNTGKLFEITPEKEVVWEYVNPVIPDTLAEAFNLAPKGLIVDDGNLKKAKVAGQAKKEMGTEGAARAVFRAERYGVDFPAFKDKDMTPRQTIEDMQAHKQ